MRYRQQSEVLLLSLKLDNSSVITRATSSSSIVRARQRPTQKYHKVSAHVVVYDTAAAAAAAFRVESIATGRNYSLNTSMESATSVKCDSARNWSNSPTLPWYQVPVNTPYGRQTREPTTHKAMHASMNACATNINTQVRGATTAVVTRGTGQILEASTRRDIPLPGMQFHVEPIFLHNNGGTYTTELLES